MTSCIGCSSGLPCDIRVPIKKTPAGMSIMPGGVGDGAGGDAGTEADAEAETGAGTATDAGTGTDAETGTDTDAGTGAVESPFPQAAAKIAAATLSKALVDPRWRRDIGPS